MLIFTILVPCLDPYHWSDLLAGHLCVVIIVVQLVMLYIYRQCMFIGLVTSLYSFTGYPPYPYIEYCQLLCPSSFQFAIVEVLSNCSM